MQSTLRKVANNLWVSDVESAIEKANSFAVIIDCLGDTSYGGTKAKILHVRPTGSTGHAWTIEDLNKITRVMSKVWPANRVLIHCRRGASRSPVAAAAALLAAGMAHDPEAALAKTAAPGLRPATQSVSGLLAWWADRQQGKLGF